MKFQAAGSMIELCILSALKKEDMYGYLLTRKVAVPLGLSESTLYPVLRRLKKEGYLDVYDQNFDGRNRRYYALTDQGKEYVSSLEIEWREFVTLMNRIVTGKNPDQDGKEFE